MRKKKSPANDNLPVANDNHKRADYMRGYMSRRRRCGKTLLQLLRDSLDFVPADDPNAQAYISAVRDRLDAQPPADHAQDAS